MKGGGLSVQVRTEIVVVTEDDPIVLFLLKHLDQE